MASVAVAVRLYLLSEATITNLIASRIYPDDAPEQPTRPFVTYRKMSGSGEGDLSGGLVSERTRIEFEIEADNQEEADNVAFAIKNVIMRPQTKNMHSGCVILGFELGAIRTNTVPPRTGSDQRRYLTTIDFEFLHLPQ